MTEYSPLNPTVDTINTPRLIGAVALSSLWIWITDPLYFLLVEGRTDHVQWIMDMFIIGQLPLIFASFVGYTVLNRFGMFRDGPVLAFTIGILVLGRVFVSLLFWNYLPIRLEETFGFEFGHLQAFMFELGTHSFRLVALGMAFSLTALWLLKGTSSKA